jgi:UDP:flavonoid glycosyltransferase YjiC (YdhE family)
VRVLFASTRGAGHFNPLVPFVDAALRGGHEVMVAGPPPLAEAVERAGYPFWQGEAPPEELLGPVWARVPTLPPDEANAVVIGEIFGELNVAAMLPSLEEACERWRPDLVFREVGEFASAIAAERHGVPHARLAVFLAALEELAMELAGPALERRQAGIVERIRASPYLTLFPASLEDPQAPLPEVVHRFRDPAAGASSNRLPDWWPGDDRPLVYVSYGTVAGTLPGAAELYANVLAAAAELPARVLLTVGDETDLDTLGPAPANVRVERFVPQREVFGHASAVVSHGGSGTTLGALSAGLPLVVVPLFADQPDNARRVAAVGAGVVSQPDPESLAAAIASVLREPAYATAAGAVAVEMAALPPTEVAFDVLELGR